MTSPDAAALVAELEAYLQQHPDLTGLEAVSVDMNGMLRGKRIPRAECSAFFASGISSPASVALMNSRGDACETPVPELPGGDPDMCLWPVAGTLAPTPWLASNTHQVLATWTRLDGAPLAWDPRVVLQTALRPLTEMGLTVVLAAELEFYLLEPGAGPVPVPRLATIPGTDLKQEGIQYAAQEDLWEFDQFLEGVRRTCELQGLPCTTAHTEWAPGQLEINLQHVDQPLLACDQTVLLKRAIKGVAHELDMAATFMAKPFAEHSGSGLHIHVSLYDSEGNNIFAPTDAAGESAVSEKLRHAIGGLASTMPEAQAIFAPNANSYRRLQPDSYVPLTPNWGFNHRGVAMRIPVSNAANRRIEHRVAGADANPYLVVAAILGGIHHGLVEQLAAPEPVPDGARLRDQAVTLPTDWAAALDALASSRVLPAYLGAEYLRLFAHVRRDEYLQFQREISNRDYEWYLRSV